MVRKLSEREKELNRKADEAMIERASWLHADRDAVHAGIEEMFRRQIKRGVIV